MPWVLRPREVVQPGRLNAALAAGRLSSLFELLTLAGWTLFVCRRFLDLDPKVGFAGGEYYPSIQSHFAWERLKQCGFCAMWNGNIRGGYPAFVETHDATLHPVVVVSSLLFGALNGAKIALIVIFFLGGSAQWWLAKELGFGKLARLWSAGMAVAAGNLAGKMDSGIVGAVVSTVSAALLLAATVHFVRAPDRRSSAILGVAIALLTVSGMGYLQVGFALVSPLLLLLVFEMKPPWKSLLTGVARAAGIGGLLAAPFLLPLARFYPRFGKFIDPYFVDVQAFRYIPVNLVVNQRLFFTTEILEKKPYPFLYVNYIGLIAVLLAIIGLVHYFHVRARLALFLSGWILATFWLASGAPMIWVRDHSTRGGTLWEFVVGLRSCAMIAGLAIPALLLLAAAGVEQLWNWLEARWLTAVVASRWEMARRLGINSLVCSLLLLTLGWTLFDARQAAQEWLQVREMNEEVAPVLDQLQTRSAEWIDPPHGEIFFAGEAMARNMKLSSGVIGWQWNGREDPQPVKAGFRFEVPDGWTVQTRLYEIAVAAAPAGNSYATIPHADGSQTPCVATSRGGNIDVTCETTRPGQLRVYENWYAGWKVEVDGASRPVLRMGQWLGAEVPAGTTRISFRYRPWDVPLGVGLFLVGLAATVFCVVRPGSTRRASAPPVTSLRATGV